jgi:hypothetical protein
VELAVVSWQWWFSGGGDPPLNSTLIASGGAIVVGEQKAEQGATAIGVNAETLTIGEVHHHYPPVGPAEPEDLPWNIPPPVRSFGGRDPELKALDATFVRQRASALQPAAALHGTPGMGKTQVARAFARQNQDDYNVGWWISAETKVTVTAGLAELAVRLGAPADLPQTELATRAVELLNHRARWLLVFDNAAEPSVLEPYWPSGRGDIIVTSRNPAWRGMADPIPVERLPLPFATRLLLDRTGETDEDSAETLAKALGRLPLALEQAAAYIEQSAHLSLAQYKKEFRRRRNKLLGKGTPLAYNGTVDATFTLAVEQLANKSEAAVQLLRISAFLAPDQLPLDLLLSIPDLLPKPLDDAARDTLTSAETIGLLYEASLFTPDVGDTARIHQLVQAVTLAHLSDRDRLLLLRQATTLFSNLFPVQSDQPETWQVGARLFPHARTLLSHAGNLVDPTVGYLSTMAGVYVWARGLNLSLARELDEQALNVWRRLHSGDHQVIASSLTNLAVDLRELGEVERAQELDEQAIAMWRRMNLGDHPDLALALNNLASSQRILGKVRRARELDEQALAMRLRLYSGDHSDTALSRANLALDLRLLGEVQRAKKLDQQALAMCQRLYSGDHPRTARSLSNLATDLHELGDFRRAQELHEQALAMRKRLYAGDHSDTAESLNALGADLRELGELQRARDLHEQALAMCRRLYDGDHSEIADSLCHLGIVLRELGELERAQELIQQGLAMYQRLFPDDHPAVALAAEYLAILLDYSGDSPKAQALHNMAFEMRKRLYGDDHPFIIASLMNLGNHLRKVGEIERALELHQQALAILRRLYPKDHPNIARSLASLASDLRKLGADERARELDAEAQAMWRRLFPEGPLMEADDD